MKELEEGGECKGDIGIQAGKSQVRRREKMKGYKYYTCIRNMNYALPHEF
jgi:hypothetical protein